LFDASIIRYVIEDFESVGFGIKPPTMTRQLQKLLPNQQSVETMMSYFEERRIENGGILLEQGDQPGEAPVCGEGD
jgi:hypothetical protein